MPAGKSYLVTLGGVQNPRYQIIDAQNDIINAFMVKTYDRDLVPSNPNADQDSIIDLG
jgi:hypothetical protein